MNKLSLTLVGLALAAFSASAQDAGSVLDYSAWDDFNKVEFFQNDHHVETSLSFALPMQFGTSILTDVNYQGEWRAAEVTCPDFLQLETPRNFVYSLEMVSMRMRSGIAELSLGLRWTYMNFTFSDQTFTLRQELGRTYVPFPIALENPTYNYSKSKLFASYLGIPVRFSLHSGKAKFYAGASAELLMDGYTKYKHPKVRQPAPGLFNKFRATVEAGVSLYGVGLFVNYGFTPLFPERLSDARTLTFGLTLGL